MTIIITNIVRRGGGAGDLARRRGAERCLQSGQEQEQEQEQGRESE